MGQAFDRDGNVLGEAFGDTKREVFDKLNQEFQNAHEIRIRSLEDGQAGASMEMPRYRCHKEVHALKIKAVEFDSYKARQENRETDGSALLVPDDGTYGPILVDWAYVRKHDPQPGGYYVVYKDGYRSFSPADAFEDGYTRL